MSLFSKKKLNELQAKESSSKKHTVLIVDDEESNRKVMASVLRDFYNVLETEDGVAALELVKSMDEPEKISMVISDQRMPNMTGVELFEQLATIIPKTVRIIVTGFIDVESIIDSVNKAHIYKFILKPFERVDFLWTAKRAVETFELQKKLDDHMKSLEQRVYERTKELAAKNEELQQAYHKLEEVSLTDQLTSLKNRRFLNKYLDADISMVIRQFQDFANSSSTASEGATENNAPAIPNHASLLFFIVDIDHFKLVNDKYGHAAGDALLMAIKPLLEQVFRTSDYLVRWGGEEFLIVARNANASDGEVMAERLRALIAENEFALPDDITIHKTCSIGFSCFPLLASMPEAVDWEQVVNIADKALYAAKNSGRNAWVGITAKNDIKDEHLGEQIIEDIQLPIAKDKLSIQSNLLEHINWN